MALVLLSALMVPLSPAKAADVGPSAWVTDKATTGSFALARQGQVVPIRFDEGDYPVVGIAAADLAADLARVAGTGPNPGDAATARTQVWLGTLGKSSLIDGLVAAKKVDVTDLKGAWESFVITLVKNPAPGVDQALVIIGSDRRGTAYGAYEVSRAVGVSPWNWWADVPPPRRPDLFISAGTRRFGPPTVKYRGIFINDEDWGLQPWAANTFDPALGDIGPKTYEKVFGLMLRLRANILWPAMHEVTQPFNNDPANAKLADRFGIVMGTSHAEAMLRNNVGEWKAPAADFNYSTHPEQVRAYWRERLLTNRPYENIYTLGMRGIHDTGMVGVKSIAEKQALVNGIIADQRKLLTDNVSTDVERIPQVFTPYKEVLEIYRAGLNVPDDVTLVWPDDNFGYIRQYPGAKERQRSGGSGVYYHLSYLGAPMSHLWLSTISPALIEQEMGRAHDLGADRLWVANVGDIKPAETNTELFLTMAWDMKGFRAAGGASGFLKSWAAREFGPELSGELASLLETHHQLSFERKPEQLQWWIQGQRYRFSDLDIEAAQARLDRFAALVKRLDAILPRVPAEKRDAFFQLVEYPVRAAALANQRFFDAEAYERLFNSDPITSRQRGQSARVADTALKALTRRYNQEIAGGKWNRIMSEEPADGNFRQYRPTPVVLPAEGLELPANAPPPSHPRKVKTTVDEVVIQAEDAQKIDSAWRLVPGLGRGKGAMALGPVTAAPVEKDGPGLTFTLDVPPGEWDVVVDVIPTFPIRPDQQQRLAVIANDGAPAILSLVREAESAAWAPSLSAWAQGVLDGRVHQETGITLTGGRQKLRVEMRDPGPVVDAILLRRRNPG